MKLRASESITFPISSPVESCKESLSICMIDLFWRVMKRVPACLSHGPSAFRLTYFLLAR